MNSRMIIPALVFSILTVGTALWAADQPPAPVPVTNAPVAVAATNGIGPKIQFETMMHDFGRAKSGEQVKYTYIFTNIGDQSLELTAVHACGCITADFTKHIEPGKTGTVPISFNSTGYSGLVPKTITVTCNDRANPQPMLQFKGIVWKPLDVIPQWAILNLTSDAPLTPATVVLTNNMPEPISLFEPQCNNPAFAVELKTNQPGREFRVVITPVSPLAVSTVQAQITLKTSWTNMPIIPITAVAYVQPAVSISPPQLVLPMAPLAQRYTNTINFTDSSTNAVALSEPTINATGVDVLFKEVVPGRQFAATLTFPQGFEIAPGQKVELSVKSSFASMPVLKMPILQASRPVPPMVAPVNVSSAIFTNRPGVRPPTASPPMPPR